MSDEQQRFVSERVITQIAENEPFFSFVDLDNGYDKVQLQDVIRLIYDKVLPLYIKSW